MPSINFNRDTSNDLVWNSDTNSYESASEPSGTLVLTDGNGNVYTLNGSALVVGAPEPETVSLSFTKTSSITSYTIDETTYTSNATVELTKGTHVIKCVGSNHIYINNEGTYKSSGSNISFEVNETSAVFTGDGVTITCSISNSIVLSSVNEPV